MRTLIIAIAGVVVVVAITLLIADYAVACDWAERGQRGDFWGGHVAAIAGTGSFMFLLLTVWMQHQQLRDQRKELQEAGEHLEEERSTRKAELELLKAQVSSADRTAVIAQIQDIIRLRIEIAFQAEQAPQHLLGASRKLALQLNERTGPVLEGLLSSPYLKPDEAVAWRNAAADIKPPGGG